MSFLWYTLNGYFSNLSLLMLPHHQAHFSCPNPRIHQECSSLYQGTLYSLAI